MNRATFADTVEFAWGVLFFIAIGFAMGLAWCFHLPAGAWAWMLRQRIMRAQRTPRRKSASGVHR